MGFIIRKSIFYDMMDGNQLKYEFDNRDLDHITFKKEERRMMFICGDDIASLIKRFENESK